MKSVLIGDIHGRTHWKTMIDKVPDAKRVVFVGDYFDSQEISPQKQIVNFLHIVAYKLTHPEREVVMLIGNHDHHYFPGVGNQQTKGYQENYAHDIELVIRSHREHLQLCHQFDDFLVSHAGVSSVFMDNTFGAGNWQFENISSLLNELYLKDPLAFRFNGTEPSGDDPEQGPLWIRPESLIKSNHNRLEKECIQVFGHTKIDRIHRIAKITNSRYHLIDTLGTSAQFMVIEDGSIRYDKLDTFYLKQHLPTPPDHGQGG